MSEAITEPQRWLSIGEAAALLSVHVTTLRRWADDGQIPCTITPGGHRRFSSRDITQFIEQQRLVARKGDIEQTWAEAALTVTRQSLAEHKDERWLGTNGGWREEHRRLGRQLMGMTMQFISAADDEVDHFLNEARQIGRRYAEIARRTNLPLADSLSASLFFRDMLIETVFHLPETVRIRPESTARLLHRINTLLNTVHLTIAQAYDEADHDILPRD